MRVQPETSQSAHPRRRGAIVLIALVALIVLVIVVQALAGFYSNFLWFHWTGVGTVWRTVTATKIVLAVVFFLIAFALIWTCLLLVDKVVARSLFLAPDTELVRRYQAVVGPHAFWLRTLVAFLVGLALGSSTASQWQHWLLFENAVSFGSKDPEFLRDISYFVFRLPFLSFLVDWIFGLLLVAFIVTAIAYFLNGAIRVQGTARIEPRAIAHLSLLLSLMALERAWAYYFVDRFILDLSQRGYVAGAGYTDVHVRLPAMTLLAVVSLVAFFILVFNVYQRTWALPAIAVGMWAFLAIAVGAIYPALFQALKVTPAQSTLEQPYIQRNITATRAAIGIANVASQQFPANEDLTPGVLLHYQQTLDDAQLWDPGPSQATFIRLQDKRSYYSLTNLSIDRYTINGVLTPVDIGVRALNSSGVPSPSWVNTHLQFTHGYGAVVAGSNTADSDGNPNFALANIPSTTTAPSLKVTQPEVYFAPGDDQYVIADTRQPEVEYGEANGQLKEGSYSGSGGIPIDSFLSRLAFSIHLRDFNLLITNEIQGKSKLIYIPDAQIEVQKALPFLQVDTHPYAVIDDGQIDWVFDAYTTTSYYPYGQPAQTSVLPYGSGLGGSYNYVRDAAKVVVNAFTGKMTFYAIDASRDPLMMSYERIFPHMFKPLSSADPVLLQHLRYPQDLLMVQSAMYGRYHITSPSQFYSLSNAWDLSQTSTSASGNPSEGLPLGSNGAIARFTPIYELLQLPNESSPTFSAIEPLVPYSSDDKVQTLAALLVANSDAADYGTLQAFQTPSGGSVNGPQLVNAAINSNPTVSKEITFLNQGGSTVLFGAVQILPIADSLLYVRPLYVSSSQTAFPQLQFVVVVYGGQVEMEPTLGAALADVFGASVNQSTTPGSSTTLPSEVRTLIAEASQDYQSAQTALAKSDLGTYQSDVDEAGQLLSQANQLLAASSSSTKSSRATATTTPTKAKTSASVSSTGATASSSTSSSGASSTAPVEDALFNA